MLHRLYTGWSGALLIGAAVLVSGCQATIGNTSIWARPAVAVPPRAVDIDDGGEYVYVERFDPRGDSLFIMIRIYPNADKENQSVISSKLRKWPEKILKEIREE